MHLVGVGPNEVIDLATLNLAVMHYCIIRRIMMSFPKTCAHYINDRTIPVDFCISIRTIPVNPPHRYIHIHMYIHTYTYEHHWTPRKEAVTVLVEILVVGTW